MGLEGVDPPYMYKACGPQAEGIKKSLPQWRMSKASRDDDKKVYLGEKLVVDSLGRDSPGCVYTPKPQTKGPSFGFGTAVARPPPAGAKYPEASADLLGTPPERLVKKTYNPKITKMGNCPRYAPSVSPDLDLFPPGAVSPGPMRYKTTDVRKFKHAPPRWTMRPQLKIIEAESQTGVKVGPGSYPVPEACTVQTRSEKPSLPRWSFGKVPRFQVPKPDGDGRLWDGMGEKKLQFQRSFSSPSFGFGSGTRGGRNKLHPAMTPADTGPVEKMPRPHEKHPKLSPRKEILRYADPPEGG